MYPAYTEIKIYKTRTKLFLASFLLMITAHSAAQTFSSQSSTTFPNPTTGYKNIIADFDGDGDADVLFQTGANGSSFSYARSNGNGTYTIVAQAASPFAGLTLPDATTFPLYRTDDFDGDGDIDVWIPVGSATGTYFRNDGSSFSSQSSTGFPSAQFQSRNIVADFDGDGDADVLYQTGADASAFSYARNNGNATFTILAQASSPFAGLTLPNASQLSTYRTADFDGDGDIDVWATANNATGTYFRNDGSSFSSQSSTTFPNAQFMGRNVIGDFDADGDADILFQTGADASAFSYARSNGDGTFTTVAQASSPFAGLTLDNVSTFGLYKANDIDGDGDIDVWMAGNGTTGTYLSQNGSPPTLSTTNPVNDASGVVRQSNITLTFSESVTKNAGNITIVKASDNSVIETINVTSGQVTGSGTSWVINPSVTLASNTTFNVRIAAGAFLDATSTEFPGISGAQYQFTTGVALPLFWLSVSAVFVNDQVSISWKTAEELNTSHFNVERSTDGVSFNSIGQIASANAPGEHSYAFDDKLVQQGYTYYYRLKQVDIDGQYNYAEIYKVNIPGERVAVLKVRNNPVQSDMVIAVTLPEAQNTRLILVNPAGVTVLERKQPLPAGETGITLQTSHLARGTYYLVLYTGRDKLRTTLIKQ